MIISGGSDKLINVWDCAKGELCGSLIGHSENICKLTVFPVEKKTNPFVFGSASWDGSARCWTEELSPAGSLTLKPTDDSTCWSVAALGRDVFVTAHADRSIRIWRGDKQVQAINSAHSDVVRDLCALEPNCFVSVGNDGTVKVWDASSGKEIQSLRSGHPSFVYGVTWNGSDRIATFGEDGIVKVWKWDGEERKLAEEETLRVPMMSSWCAVFLNENCLIVGGSTGTLYAFNSGGTVKSVVCDAFEAELAAFDEAAKARKSSEIEKNSQDESALKYPGERIGKTILVKRAGKIEAHQWDGQEWQNLGQVVDPLSVEAPDFTFKVELDDTGKSYSLPYSWGENPYSVAKNFLERNDLPIGYLDQVANFIVQNAGTPPPSTPEPQRDFTVKPEVYKIDAYNSEGVTGKLKSFGLNEIGESEICRVLTVWPLDKLFPCLDWLRFNVLLSDSSKCLAFVPFDAILEAGSGGKEVAAAVTMSLRLLCNATSTCEEPVDPNLIVKVIGKCTNSPGLERNSTTWVPLMIGLLYNTSVKRTLEVSKQAALLHGILTKLNTANEDAIERIWWILKEAGEPIPLAASIKSEIERIPEMKDLLKLFN